MSRHDYNDECDGWALIRWRGAVAAATKGARGQKMLCDLLGALDAMPIKRLIAGELELSGVVCAIGCLGKAKGIDMSGLDPADYESVAKAFNIAPALTREIVYMNDDYCHASETPEQRWTRMRSWVAEQIV